MLIVGNAKLCAVQTARLLAGAVRHAHGDHALVVLLGRNNEARAWLDLGVKVVMKVAR